MNEDLNVRRMPHVYTIFISLFFLSASLQMEESMTIDMDVEVGDDDRNVLEAGSLHRGKAKESVLAAFMSELKGNESAIETEDSNFIKQTNHEKKLVAYLMRHYDNTIRPVRDSRSPVVIRLGITLTQIFDLDEKNQVLTTNVWLDQEWMDEFLVWPKEKFGNLTKIRIPCEKLWLPDIVLYNSADDYTRGYMNSKAMIEPNGNVFWPPPTKFRSTCPVDVTYFPFDDQTCIMKLGSWIYDGLQVDILNRTAEVDLSNYVANGEWDLLDAQIVRNVVYYSCCPEPFPDVTITIKIRRKTLYYMYNVVFPCMMMSVLTLLVFCLPPDSGEKIALGVTVLLAFSVFMLAISEKLPETSESIPLLGIYLTAVMAITSVSVIMTVIVINIHYRGPSKRAMPLWLKNFLLNHVIGQKQLKKETQHLSCQGPDNFLPENYISTRISVGPELAVHSSHGLEDGPYSHGTEPHSPPHLIRSSESPTTPFPNNNNRRDSALRTMVYQTEVHSSNLQPFHLRKPDIHSLNGNSTINTPISGNLPVIGSNSITEGSSSRGASAAGGGGGGGGKKGRKSGRNSHDQSNVTRTSGFIHSSPPPPPAPSPALTGAALSNPQNEEMVRILRYLFWRQQHDDHESSMMLEWKLLALAIDKVLFWVFLVITAVSSASFLLIIPVQRRGLGFIFG